MSAEGGQGPSGAGLLSRECTGVAADNAGATASGERSGTAATSVQLITLVDAVGSTLSSRFGAASSALSLNPVDPPSWPLPLSSCDDAQTAHGTREQARQLHGWDHGTHSALRGERTRMHMYMSMYECI